jgi:predicted nucleic acid-binding Zn ribbon protein
MNKKQKAQLIIGILSAILFIVWIVLPGNIITRLLGMLSNALVMLSMYLSYRAEEKKKIKSDQ